MTVGADATLKAFPVPDTDTSVELFVVDTGGHPIYSELAPKYWKSSCAVVVVFDVSSKASFEAVPKWVKMFKDAVNDGRKVTGVLIGNKTDLRATHPNCISTEDGQTMAETVGLTYCETSVVEGSGFKEPFANLASSIMNVHTTRVGTLLNA